MPDLTALSGISSIIGGLSGIFGKKQKAPTPRENMLSQAQGAREAAEKYGFNPLTMLQYGQTSGSIGSESGPSPLASIQLITDGLIGLDDVLSGDAARRRAADQLNLDLAQLKLEQARSGVVAVVPSHAVDAVGVGQSPLGRRPVEAYTSHGGDLGPRYERPNRDHPLSSSLGDVPQPDPTLDRGSGHYFAGVRLESAPGFSTGEQFETEYGDVEPLTWAHGLAKVSANIGYNSHKLQNYALGSLFGDGSVMSLEGKDFVLSPYTHKQPSEAPRKSDLSSAEREFLRANGYVQRGGKRWWNNQLN